MPVRLPYPTLNQIDGTFDPYQLLRDLQFLADAMPSRGTATMSSGATSVTVTHGMGQTPSAVIVTGGADIGDLWVTAIGLTTFVINTDTAPSGDKTVYWLGMA